MGGRQGVQAGNYPTDSLVYHLRPPGGGSRFNHQDNSIAYLKTEVKGRLKELFLFLGAFIMNGL
jgi:hypothetical protein